MATDEVLPAWLSPTTAGDHQGSSETLFLIGYFHRRAFIAHIDFFSWWVMQALPSRRCLQWGVYFSFLPIGLWASNGQWLSQHRRIQPAFIKTKQKNRKSEKDRKLGRVGGKKVERGKIKSAIKVFHEIKQRSSCFGMDPSCTVWLFILYILLIPFVSFLCVLV